MNSEELLDYPIRKEEGEEPSLNFKIFLIIICVGFLFIFCVSTVARINKKL